MVSVLQRVIVQGLDRSTISTSGASAATDSNRSPRLVSEITNSRSLCTSSRLARASTGAPTPRRIHTGPYSPGEALADLKHQRGLADSRRAAHQHQRALGRHRRPGPVSSPMPVENQFPHPPPAPSPAGPCGRSPSPAGREAPFPAARAAWGLLHDGIPRAPQAGHFPAHLGVSLPHSVR